MNHVGTQQLETDRLILRRYTKDDASAIYKNWASDDEVTKYLTWPTHESQEVTQTIIDEWVKSYSNENYYHWAIVLKENGDEPVGDIAVVHIKEKASVAHIGYCTGRKWWNQGITSEAFAAIIPYFFNEVGVNRIESQHDPNNPYSGNVMKKCGLRYEGTLRQADSSNKGIVDACVYSLLKSEWIGK